MANDRQSITFKVLVGYLLFAVLAGLAVWFVYSQVRDYTEMAEAGFEGNQKLYLVGEAAADLYEAESLSRQLIQSGSSEDLELYEQKVVEIQETLDALIDTHQETFLQQEIDSIRLLLEQKTNNLKKLLHLRQQQGDQSYYSRVLTELQRMNGSFQEPNYEERWSNLEPHQRRYLQKLLEFSELDSPSTVSTGTLDSLVEQVKTVLIDFEAADRRYRQSLRAGESELLSSEIEINSQLRNLLSAIEEEERQASNEQVHEARELVRETSRTIAILGAASFLVILVFLFLVIKDVTRSQRYRKQLEDAKQYTETLLKSREQFMATVTHDLRSPLNTVEGYTDLLQNTALSTTQQEYLRQLKNSSAYILRLVNDLLDMAKLEAGKMTIELLPFNPKNLIEDTVQNTIPARLSNSVEVKVEVDPALNRNVKSDPFRIRQIITNLVTNAIKFTQKGEVQIKASLDNAGVQSRLVVAVKDTGIGISKEKKEQIFEEFSQEDSSIEKRFGGSGLGLAITKKLTELLHGEISLRSEPGVGSEFIVIIPIEKVATRDIENLESSSGNLPPMPSPHTSPQPAPPMEPEQDLSSTRVLLVDDEPAQLGLLGELVKSAGMSFEKASNGKEALARLEQETFHLVLTDIQMPQMDGFDLLQEIQKRPELSPLPVIALSGRGDVSLQQYIEKGFSGSLIKPYSSTKLLELIEETLQVNLQLRVAEQSQESTFNGQYSLDEVRLFAGGEPAALDSILSTFIISTQTNLEALTTAFNEERKHEIKKIAHKMLPMFRQLKAHVVVKQLEFLESTPPQGIVREHLKLLQEEVNSLVEELQKEIKKTG